MRELLNFVKELLNNEYVVYAIMAVVIFIGTQILKLPIKAITNKIKNERARRIVNGIILLIPFALGLGLEYAMCRFINHDAFNIIEGLTYGTAGISFYGVVERFFKVKTNNPYKTEEGKAVVELVQKVTADGKVDVNDKSAIQEYFETLKK